MNGGKTAPVDAPDATLNAGFVSEAELAARWNLHRRTLQRWRCEGLGPAFIQLGRRLVYRPCDIAAFEARMRHDPLG